MAKFFITNDATLFNKVRNLVETSRYKPSFEYCDCGAYALSVKKLAVDNVNGIQINDGFAIVTGTMAWKEGQAIDTQSLKNVYETFTGDVNYIRKESIGNYASVIYKFNTLYVFGEVAGFYNIYYYSENGLWFVSNSLYDMAILLKSKVTINKLALIEASVQDGILLNDTYFNEIHRLSGFDHLVISGDELRVVVGECFYPLQMGNIDVKVKKFVDWQKNYGLRMFNAYGTPTISMTGGLDARMTMSTYLAAGVKPHLYYGVGNSFITNTYKEDKEIDEIFSERFGLTLHTESWHTPEPFDKYWESNLETYGFYYETYAGSNDVIETIRNNPNILFTYGYCGELYRNLPWIEMRRKDYFTLDEYINEVYITPQVRNVVINTDVYYAHIKKKLLIICEYYRLNPNHIDNEDIFYLSLERRKSADSVMLNYVNLVKYCCYTLGQYESLVAGRVSCKEAENSGFMLRCLDALYPEVLDLPVFSHCKMRTFNRETMRLSSQNNDFYTVKNRIKDIIKNYVPFILGIYRYFIHQKKQVRFENDEFTINKINDLSNELDTYEVVNGANFSDIRRLISYVMKVYAINSLKLDK